jgi:hypothetical protein
MIRGNGLNLFVGLWNETDDNPPDAVNGDPFAVDGRLWISDKRYGARGVKGP